MPLVALYNASCSNDFAGQLYCRANSFLGSVLSYKKSFGLGPWNFLYLAKTPLLVYEIVSTISNLIKKKVDDKKKIYGHDALKI